MEGRGNVALWGASPGLNLNYFNHLNTNENESDWNVLSIGAADPRHLIETLRTFQFKKNLNFHVIESQAPLIARMLLFVDILLSSREDYSAQYKSEKYLEVFGNIFLRQQTWEFIQSRCADLIRVVTDEKGIMAQIFDFSHLKFKEKDDLEFVFNFWRDNKKKFDVMAMWDHRLRRLYGSRFDSKENIIDWDYHFRLLKEENKDVDIIHKKEFSNWRMTGVAFEIREAVMNIPNRTMATVQALKEDGISTTKWGYFSDISSGPFICLGLNPSNPDDLKKTNGNHTKTSQHIATKTLEECIENLLTHFYSHKDSSTDSTCGVDKNVVEKLKITVLPFDTDYTFIKRKSKFTKKFHIIILACHQALHLNSCSDLLADHGIVIIERPRLLFDFNEQQQQWFEQKILDLAKSLGFRQVKSEYAFEYIADEKHKKMKQYLIEDFHLIFKKTV